MKILWLSHLIPYPPKGGVQQRSYNLMRELSKHHEVSVISFFQKAHQPDAKSLDEAVAHLNQFCQVLDVLPIQSDTTLFGKLEVAIASVIKRCPYTILWLKSKRFEKAILKAIDDQKFDLIHFDTISLAQYRGHFGNATSALTHHNVESDMLLRRASNSKRRLERWFFNHEGNLLKRYEGTFGQSFDLHVACSDVDAERIRSLVPNAKVFTAPNGADLDYFAPAPAHNESVKHSLVFAGGLSWYPNASAMRFFFDQVWSDLLREIPDVSISVIGKNPPEWLVDLARSDRHVRVTGFVDDVRPYLHEAEVYVCPIYDGGGTKLKMVDALACGKAIVAHPVACEGLDVIHNEHVIVAESSAEFVREIKRLFDNNQLRERIQKNARLLAERSYSFTAIGHSLAVIYENLIAKQQHLQQHSP